VSWLRWSAAPAAEDEQMAAVGIALERLQHRHRQAIKALAHAVPDRQPRLHAARIRGHRAPALAKTLAWLAQPHRAAAAIKTTGVHKVGCSRNLGSDRAPCSNAAAIIRSSSARDRRRRRLLLISKDILGSPELGIGCINARERLSGCTGILPR